jgi:hypothetical protein
MITLPIAEDQNAAIPTSDTTTENNTGTVVNAAETLYKVESLEPPVFKRYAHHGKRRRSYTEEMFRCQFTDMISRTPLICNHLLWKNKPDELRNHLLEHLKVEEVQDLTDAQVSEKFQNAKRIFLEGIPEDLDEDGNPPEDDEEI